MASAAKLRAKARGYLKQADACRDDLFAQELRELARKLGADADRFEAAAASKGGQIAACPEGRTGLNKSADRK